MEKARTRKVIASEWTTLDGVFDASTLDTWFAPYHTDERGQIIDAAIHAADALLFGRVTYEMLSQYWSRLKNNEMGIADRLNSLPKYVASNTLKRADWNNTTILDGNVAGKIRELQQQPGQDILIFGSAALVRSLLPLGLVDEVHLLVQPIVVGAGKRLFEEGVPTTRLQLIDSRPLAAGVVNLRYRVG